MPDAHAAALARMRDALPVNAAYDGVVAEAYDVWLPVGTPMPGDDLLADVARAAPGPTLELGSGNGRFLLPLLGEGVQVEGLDTAADMHARCRANAARMGLDPVLHLGSMAPLALGRRYGAIVVPAGSFTLLDDREAAAGALVSWLDHLVPGGTLALPLFVPPPQPEADAFVWRLRRTGTRDDGTTFVVHEAVATDVAAQQVHVVDRHETYDDGGRLVATLLRRHLLRWWGRDEIEAALGDAGFVAARSQGSTSAWVTLAEAPGT